MSPGYDRLSMEDAQFLAYESPTNAMHIGGLMIFDPGPLRTEAGGVDIEVFRQGVASVLHRVPRFRQRLKWIPVAHHPVWVDDADIDIRYHVRHSALPRPGTVTQLKELVGRLMSQQLDRDKPLWEYWVIEGLEGGRFALFTKIHHCMMDGTAGSDLSHVLMSPTPEWEPEPPPDWTPRPEPRERELLADAVVHRMGQPLEAVRGFGAYLSRARDLRADLEQRARAVQRSIRAALEPAVSPFAASRTGHRRSDWLVVPLEPLKRIRRSVGGTLNDVVLAGVAGAFRAFLEERGQDPARTSMRTVVPVSVRSRADDRLGNRISTWILPLPVAEPDPLARLRAVWDSTTELKASNTALGTKLLMQFAEFGPSAVLSLAARASRSAADTFVTNVPGPQFPLYMFGARMLHMLPQVPLLPGMGIGVGLMSYDGNLCWGVTADAEVVPDVRVFVRCLDRSLRELEAALGPAEAEPAPGERVTG